MSFRTRKISSELWDFLKFWIFLWFLKFWREMSLKEIDLRFYTSFCHLVRAYRLITGTSNTSLFRLSMRRRSCSIHPLFWINKDLRKPQGCLFDVTSGCLLDTGNIQRDFKAGLWTNAWAICFSHRIFLK